MTPDEALHPGDIIQIGPGAGPACRHMYARVIRVNNWPSWDGMAWLDVHETDAKGRVLEAERMAYIGIAGIRIVRCQAEVLAQAAKTVRQRGPNAGPVRIPRPRTSPETTNGRTR